MHPDGIKLLKLMFNEGETVCVSDSKYGYHSMPLESTFKEKVNLVHPNPDQPIREALSDSLVLVALNPILGFRQDINSTAFRSFLVEMDSGPLDQQIEYIKTLKMPYSAAVFSGGKSVHFLITLDINLPNEEHYRKISKWILNIVTMADQNTQNPSRSIRIPGPKRDDKFQSLLELKGKISIGTLSEWLKTYPDAAPKVQEKREVATEFNFYNVKEWVRDLIVKGLDPSKGRNKQWFTIACEFALSGASEYDTIESLRPYFVPDRDFKEKEWITTIKSGFSYIKNNR